MKEKPQKAPECASEAFCGFGIFRTSAKMRNSAEGGWRLLQQQAVSVLAVDGQVDFRAVVGQQQGLAAVLQQGIDRNAAHRAGGVARLVEQLARGKCLAVAKEHPGAVVLGCDTVVDVNGEVFGKPHSLDDARRMLRALSGATHYVHTGVCVSDGTRTESFVDTCKVTFFPLSEEEIERYAATEEPYDKAGAYAIQGRAAVWLDAIEGDYYTIMGLPVSRTVRLLEQF